MAAQAFTFGAIPPRPRSRGTSAIRILVVDADPELRRLLGALPGREGYAVDLARKTEALARAAMGDVDLGLFDVVLGDEDGRELLLELRLMVDGPAIFLTARGLEMDRVAGLRMRADDYVIKPFLDRRVDGADRSGTAAVVYRCNPVPTKKLGPELRYEVRRHAHRTPHSRVECDGELVDLTAKEFDLLSFLASSPRQVFSRRQLLEHV